MLLRVLGPVQARSAQGHVIRLRRREKSVLGVLLLYAGTPCSTDMLIQDVWGDDQPADPGNTLRLAVSRIRRALLPESLIATVGTGAYQADPAPGELDLHHFESLLSAASALADEDRPALEARLLEDALALWPHPQGGFPDLPDSLGVREKTERLIEQRRATEIRLIDLYLALGRHEATIPELRARCVTDPGSERTWSQLMQALILSGRRGEALAAYRHASRVLADEYGARPGHELQAMLACAMDGNLRAPPTAR
jgi:DNA-binding SARP family transcriptional activator